MSEPLFPGAEIVTDGEFAGWSYWGNDPFERSAGPFFMRRDPDTGEYVSAFRAEDRHMNTGGFMHGGCLLTFADFALFSIATDELQDSMAVTMNLSGDFLGAVKNGALVEARGEVTRGGGKTLFIRGLATADGEPALSFTGIVRKIGPRS